MMQQIIKNHLSFDGWLMTYWLGLVVKGLRWHAHNNK